MKKHSFAPNPLVHQACAIRPRLEGRLCEVGEELASIDADQLLHEPAMDADPVHDVGHAEARARHGACAIRVFQQLESQLVRLLVFAVPDGVVAMHQLWKVYLELVPVTWRVRALHLTELALKARVHDALRIEWRQFANVAVVLLVDRREQGWKRITVLEAHAAAMADFEDALDFFAERVFIPVFLFTGVVAQPIGGLVRDLPMGFVAHSRL